MHEYRSEITFGCDAIDLASGHSTGGCGHDLAQRSPQHEGSVGEPAGPVSYTHLDVYKRQSIAETMTSAYRWVVEGGDVPECVRLD